MQIAGLVPTQNINFYQANKIGFKCHQSITISTDLTKKHLANLEKLLQKPISNNPIQTEPVEPNPIRKVSNDEKRTRQNKNILEGLNLTRIWPHEMNAADHEMSPKNLHRLQRLLSMTPEYSPRNNLGHRWREYHGCNDWVGLLDPLDENLRREVIRYGEFVQAAYHCFHSDPAMSAEEAPTPRHVALPERSYKVTKSLYATSSIGLPKWIDDVAPDLGWMTQQSSWIGYVAVCDDKREIQRMGRRDIVIALRGTATCLEWAENMRAQMAPLCDQTEPVNSQSKVECGFLSLYKTKGAHVPSLSKSVIDEVKRLMELYKGETLSITVTGHSLGAALALLVGDELSAIAPENEMPPIAVFSFGGPKVGNKAFAKQINAKNVKVLRIVNNQDVITRVPGLPMVETPNDDMPLAYTHVGTELRVDTKMSPYLKPDADVACCHDLEAYLHLVDGFKASDSPFRPNAKRSLVKLLSEQRSNVKQLYTSKAKLYTSKAKSLRLTNLERPGLAATGCLPSPS